MLATQTASWPYSDSYIYFVHLLLFVGFNVILPNAMSIVNDVVFISFSGSLATY